jgi:peptidoglycan/LPS O-acetylase OafA/YrhL
VHYAYSVIAEGGSNPATALSHGASREVAIVHARVSNLQLRGNGVQARRLIGLDALRGCAAAAVMLHHHGHYYDVLYAGRAPLSFDMGAGHFGVELFFIISGFVILMTIEHRKTVRDFAIARVTRLMPAFLAALGLASVILIFWPMPPLNTPTFLQFIANLTMAPGLFGQNVVDLPYWTLTYELVFYVFMALALRFRLLGSIEWLGLLAMAVGCLYRATVDIEHHHRTTIVLLAYYSNFFLIGICLYRIQTARARPITYVALALAIAMSGLGGGEQAFRAPGWLYLPLTAAFTGLVWLATTRHARWIASPPLIFLGQISYPLYLVHVALGYQIIRFGVEQGWSTLHGVASAVMVSVVVAVVLHYLVEVPGERWSRSVLTKPRATVV